MKKVKLAYLLVLIGFVSFAQDNIKEKEDALNASTNLTWSANKALSSNDFVGAEVEYRKAIAKSDQNVAAPYNLGNAYYNQATYGEAYGRFKQAGESATNKTDKHRAYHNMGNVFMKRKEYAKAVEGYKEALRNDPKDEETRYNLALAQELLKKQQDEQNKDDKNKDNKDKDKDDKEKNKDKKDEGDEGDKGDEEDKKDKKDEGDKGKDEKEDKKEGDGDKKDEKKEPEPKKPKPNQLSKQQVQNLLQALQQKEKKVQEKIDAEKVKGVKIKNEKDW